MKRNQQYQLLLQAIGALIGNQETGPDEDKTLRAIAGSLTQLRDMSTPQEPEMGQEVAPEMGQQMAQANPVAGLPKSKQVTVKNPLRSPINNPFRQALQDPAEQPIQNEGGML